MLLMSSTGIFIFMNPILVRILNNFFEFGRSDDAYFDQICVEQGLPVGAGIGLLDALDALPRDEYVRLLRIEAGDVSLRSWIGQHFAQNGLSCA